MLRIRDLMQSLDEVVAVDQDFEEACVRMQHLRLPLLPVVDGDEVVGVLSEEDISEAYNETRGEGERLTVRDRLSSEIVYCTENDDPATAKETMDVKGHERLLVVDEEGSVTGLITLQQVEAALKPQDRPNESSEEKAEERVAETPARARAGAPGRPAAYSVKPKIKK